MDLEGGRKIGKLDEYKTYPEVPGYILTNIPDTAEIYEEIPISSPILQLVEVCVFFVLGRF